MKRAVECRLNDPKTSSKNRESAEAETKQRE